MWQIGNIILKCCLIGVPRPQLMITLCYIILAHGKWQWKKFKALKLPIVLTHSSHETASFNTVRVSLDINLWPLLIQLQEVRQSARFNLTKRSRTFRDISRAPSHRLIARVSLLVLLVLPATWLTMRRRLDWKVLYDTHWLSWLARVSRDSRVQRLTAAGPRFSPLTHSSYY